MKLLKTSFLGLVFFIMAEALFASFCLAQESQAVQITSPVDGTIAAPGQKISLSVRTDPSAGNVTVVTTNDFIKVKPDKIPNHFMLELPGNLPSGIVGLTAQTSNGSTAGININVERPDAPMSIELASSSVRFEDIGKQAFLEVLGFFPSGEVADLTNSSHSDYVVANPDIATVTPHGVVTAKGPGETMITATYAGLSSSLAIKVFKSGEMKTPAQEAARKSGVSAINAVNNGEKQPKNLCRILGAGLGFQACPLPVWHGNSYDSYDLNTGMAYKGYIDTNLWGARSDPGVAPVPIHAFDKCYYVDNNSKESYFVPFKTDEEWTSFIKYHPPEISLRACTLHGVYISASATSKGDHAVFSLPFYSTVGTEETLSQSFYYYEPQHCDELNKCSGPWNWQESITVSFRADVPTWKVTKEAVLGEPPTISAVAGLP
jgi:hypothetical protein